MEYRVEERSIGLGSAEGRLRPLGADLEAAQWQARRGSSMLTQIRTGKIGLPAYLFNRQVPGINDPLCECGRRQTALVRLGYTAWSTHMMNEY